MNRFKIYKPASCEGYIILDRLKLFTCLSDKRYTKRIFRSVEEAQGYLFAKGKLRIT